MALTDMVPQESTTDRDPDVAHIAPSDKVTEAYVEGTPLLALCGVRFVPSRDPQDLPLCQECVTIMEMMKGLSGN